MSSSACPVDANDGKSVSYEKAASVRFVVHSTCQHRDTVLEALESYKKKCLVQQVDAGVENTVARNTVMRSEKTDGSATIVEETAGAANVSDASPPSHFNINSLASIMTVRGIAEAVAEAVRSAMQQPSAEDASSSEGAVTVTEAEIPFVVKLTCSVQPAAASLYALERASGGTKATPNSTTTTTNMFPIILLPTNNSHAAENNTSSGEGDDSCHSDSIASYCVPITSNPRFALLMSSLGAKGGGGAAIVVYTVCVGVFDKPKEQSGGALPSFVTEYQQLRRLEEALEAEKAQYQREAEALEAASGGRGYGRGRGGRGGFKNIFEDSGSDSGLDLFDFHDEEHLRRGYRGRGGSRGGSRARGRGRGGR